MEQIKGIFEEFKKEDIAKAVSEIGIEMIRRKSKEEIFKETENAIRIEEKKCPICGTQMQLRRTWLRTAPYARRVMLKCQKCFNLQTFGLPRSKEEFLRQLEETGGRHFLDVVAVSGEEEEIQRRLEALGYIE